MQTTGNLGLKKPEGTDIVDIADLNGNMDILDNAVTGKVDKVTGKQLSTNDYSAAEKTKLAGIATGANNYLHPNHTGDVTSNGDGVTAIAAGVIVNADVNAAAGIDASKIGTGVVSNAEFGYLDGVTSGIQGQLNGKAPLVTTPQQTTADITYYVRTDGNDNNTGLVNTAGGAFRTIGKAVSVLPNVINHNLTINISDGAYAEDVIIKGYRIGSGALTVMGNSNTAAVNVNSVTLHSIYGTLTVEGITATSTTKDGFSINRCVGFRLNGCKSVSVAASWNGVISYFSNGYINGCTFSNKGNGVNTNGISQIYVINTTGTGNIIGLAAGDGAILSKFTNTITGTQAESVVGATITSGVLNPWGDNTVAQRSRCEAVSGATTQNISGSTFIKVQFSAKNYDALGEYDVSLSRFTAKASGIYLISATVPIAGLPALCRTLLDLQKNGGNAWRLQDLTSSTLSDASITGTTSMYLNPGDYIEIFTYIGGYNVSTVPGLGRLNIVRIA